MFSSQRQFQVAGDALRRQNTRGRDVRSFSNFLENHVETMVLVDFFAVPTIRLQASSCSWFWLTTEGGSCIST